MMEPSNSRAEVHEGEGGVEYDGEVELPLDANACPDYEDLNNTEDASSSLRDPADGHAQYELYGGGIDACSSSANHNTALFDVDGHFYPREAFPSTSAASTRPAALHQTPRIIVRDDEPRDHLAPTTSSWNDAHLQSTSSAMPATCTRRQPPVDRKTAEDVGAQRAVPRARERNFGGNPVDITPIRPVGRPRASTSATTSNGLATDEVHTTTPSKRGRKRKEAPKTADSSILLNLRVGRIANTRLGICTSPRSGVCARVPECINQTRSCSKRTTKNSGLMFTNAEVEASADRKKCTRCPACDRESPVFSAAARAAADSKEAWTAAEDPNERPASRTTSRDRCSHQQRRGRRASLAERARQV
ncbi:hypothetical protein M3Y99_00331500 [Aphelenchoides fujianensis]|nr:hypothetical protein M3Y99_00331500 [Aphelenchoides fujianensis]